MYMKLTLSATMTPQKAPLAAAAAYLRRQHESMCRLRGLVKQWRCTCCLRVGSVNRGSAQPSNQVSARVCYGGREEQRRRRMRTSMTAAKATYVKRVE